MQAFFYFIVTLLLLIVIHELGHFWVARRCGVKVLKFSVGFGRPLWKRVSKQGTEYIIAAIPLGGYVKMLDEREDKVASKDLAKTFNQQPLRSRVAILAAGPLANLLFAVLAYWVMFVIGIPGVRPIIGNIEKNSAAEFAQLMSGSEIKAINGVTTPTWAAVYRSLAALPANGDVLAISARVDGVNTQKQLAIPKQDEIILAPVSLLRSLGLSPVYIKLKPVIHSVVKGGAADKAGIRKGDVIVSVDGQFITSWSELVALVQASANKTLRVVIDRSGEPLDAVLVPARTTDNVGRIGARVDNHKTNIPDELRANLRYDPLTALLQSVQETWTFSALILKNIFGMLAGTISGENIGGPISIAQTASYSADKGLIAFINFLAMISISLAILNLLPIPILDGGHLAMCFIEWVRGRPLSDDTQSQAQKVGMMLILLIMLLAFFNDLARLFG